MSELATSNGPWLVGIEYETDTLGASSTVENWEGPEAGCRTQAAYSRNSGATRVILKPKGDGAWQLRVSYPWNNDTRETDFVDTLELEVNAVARSVYQSPIYRSKFTDYVSTSRSSFRADQTLSVIHDLARKFASGKPPQNSADAKFHYPYYPDSPNSGTAYNTRELAIYAEATARFALIASITTDEKSYASNMLLNVMERGVTSFLEYGQVFRRVVTAGSPAAVQANYTGAGKIWTTAEVVWWEGIPNDGWFYLPPDVQWHKDKPRVLKTFGRKTQLTYSYTEIITASALLYEAYGYAVLL